MARTSRASCFRLFEAERCSDTCFPYERSSATQSYQPITTFVVAGSFRRGAKRLAAPAGPWDPSRGPLQQPEPMPAAQFDAALRCTVAALMQSALRCVRGAVDMSSTPGPAVCLAATRIRLPIEPQQDLGMQRRITARFVCSYM